MFSKRILCCKGGEKKNLQYSILHDVHPYIQSISSQNSRLNCFINLHSEWKCYSSTLYIANDPFVFCCYYVQCEMNEFLRVWLSISNVRFLLLLTCKIEMEKHHSKFMMKICFIVVILCYEISWQIKIMFIIIIIMHSPKVRTIYLFSFTS